MFIKTMRNGKFLRLIIAFVNLMSIYNKHEVNEWEKLNAYYYSKGQQLLHKAKDSSC